MALERGSLTEIDNSPAKSVVQDQTACMCSLILLYTFCPNESKVAHDRVRVNQYSAV